MTYAICKTSIIFKWGGVRLFFFDPNTASAQELLMLGLKPWQVRSLLKYRIHGGEFRKPEDIGKLYGLSAKQYKTLLPYVRIDREQFMPASMIVEKDPYEPVYTSKDTFPRQHKIGVGETVDISIADTSALKTVPGIGSYFARKIVYYRNELGGYVSVGQLDEINDFPQEAKKFLVVKNAAVKKININKASLVQMKRHPYMGFFRAKKIIDYRYEHGMIRNIEELADNKHFTHEVIKKLTPYVETE
ncbi:MAG: helix-hairpin-helix domain-containing protein [Prevotella sp.]|nr:helix-hairpin-helix domain-containing protein [Prevotella sp.]